MDLGLELRTVKSARGREPQLKTHQVAWLSLDERDNDAGRFWNYVVAALQTIAPEFGAAMLALLEAPALAPTLGMPRNIVGWKRLCCEGGGSQRIRSDRGRLDGLDQRARRDRPDESEHPLILVLDDYHVIETAAIHAGITFLLDHLPPAGRLHLVIAGRSDPPLPLSRLRGRGQLNELDMNDLRFTPGEASTFLNQVMGLGYQPRTWLPWRNATKAGSLACRWLP